MLITMSISARHSAEARTPPVTQLEGHPGWHTPISILLLITNSAEDTQVLRLVFVTNTPANDIVIAILPHASLSDATK